MIETATATTNTSVQVTFNRIVGDGGDDASFYEVSSPDLRVMAASVDGDTVTLTTSAQIARTYTLEVTEVEDTAGNLIDPGASTVAFAGEGLRPSPGDADGDGLPDVEEARGWTVTVTDENGTTRSHKVTSDPEHPDTDADGVLDSQERERRLDPRQDDTDEDGLTDFDEINRYASSPNRRDSDGDSLTDGQEVSDILTSPTLADTDGDGLTDDEEYRGTGFDALIAEIPELTLEFSSDPLITLDVLRENSTDADQIEASLTEHDSKLNQTDITTTTKVVEDSHDVNVGISVEKTIEGVIGGIFGGYDYSHSETTTTERVAGWSKETRNRAKHEYQEFTSHSENQVVGGAAGGLTTTLKLVNTGQRTFKISDVIVGAFILDPDDPTRRRLLTSVESSGGAKTLGPGKDLTIAFEKMPNGEDDEGKKGEGGINSDLIGKLLADPSSLMFEVLSYTITEQLGDGSERDLEQLNESLLAQTSFVLIDFGNGDVERHLVATNVPRNLAGEAEGVPMSFVMDNLLERENGWGTAPNEDGRSTLTMVRNGADAVAAQKDPKGYGDPDAFSTWYVYGTSESFNDETVDFEDIVLKPRDAVTLVYLIDADGDGLFAREEFLYGSSDTDEDSDDDGLNDFAEVREGWSVTVEGSEPYQVYADPLSRDSDSDGLDDPAEEEAGTDPLLADTDGDGLCDGPGTPNTYTEGCISDSEPLKTRPFQTQFPKLTSSDAGNGDEFGFAVSISGDYAVVGAPGDEEYDDRGSAYVFRRSYDGSWAQEAELTSSRGSPEDFGASIAISGRYVIVGQPRAGNDTPGSAYIFKRTGDSWNEIQELISSERPDDFTEADTFGTSVSISGDYAVVGDTSRTSAYVFRRTGDSWAQEAELTANGGGNSLDDFGASVSISGDYAVVGAPRSNSNSSRGSAYVFRRTGDGWAQEAKLTASGGGVIDPRFGISVAISGAYAVVGAYSDDGGRGSAYIFERSNDGSWAQEAELTASDGADVDHAFYGSSVDISGAYAVVGAYQDDLGRGSAYIFERSNDGSWAQEVKLTSRARVAGDVFGTSVAISGEYALVGAPTSVGKPGSAYIFLK